MDLLTHHAYLSLTEPEFDFDISSYTIRRFNVPLLSIEASKEIIYEASMRPEVGKVGKIIIASFSKISREAPEALLKVLEEPPADTKIFLITQDHTSLPLTLLSRLMIWDAGHVASSGDLKSKVKKFLESNPEERLTQVTNFFDCGEEALNELEILVNKKFKGTERAYALNLLIESRSFRREPPMVPKLLWEHLALSLPLDK